MPREKPQTERPEGLEYRPDFVSSDEEGGLVDVLDRTEFHDITMRGQTAKRMSRHYGLRYDYEHWDVTPTDPLPAELGWLRERAAALIEQEAEALVETLLSKYPPGATIGWHRDAPMFGAKVVGISLASACRMRFQRTVKGERRVYDQPLEPRSAYVLGGAARSSWQHSIPAVKELRYSITFRTLKRRRP